MNKLKKSKRTTDSKIKSSLRRLWWYSRERSESLKVAKYSCQKCGKKKSTAVKLNVHHTNEIDWKKIYKYLRQRLLCSHKSLEVMCVECHKEHHYGDKKK